MLGAESDKNITGTKSNKKKTKYPTLNEPTVVKLIRYTYLKIKFHFS